MSTKIHTESQLASSQEAPQSEGARLIAAERARQIRQEGWTPAHDFQHAYGELAAAAVCYAMTPEARAAQRECHSRGADDRMVTRIQTLFSFFWPWEKCWWKPVPHDRIRELVKAGALLAAEIDRLLRQQAAQQRGKERAS